MPNKNLHKVNRAVWSRWTADQQRLFNDVFDNINRLGPSLFLHPDTIKTITVPEFETIMWNASWIAADNLVGDVVEVIPDKVEA